MATAAQIHANRLNALKSTGPRSVEGKAVARFNAVKYGTDAKSVLIPGEDAAEFEELRRQYLEEFRPCGPVEAALLETIVRSDWIQRRYVRIEAQLVSFMVEIEEDSECRLGAAFHFDASGPDALQKLFRRQQAAQRDWHRSLAELRALEEQRSRNVSAQEDSPAESAPEATSEKAVSGKSPEPLPAKGGDRLRSDVLGDADAYLAPQLQACSAKERRRE